MIVVSTSQMLPVSLESFGVRPCAPVYVLVGRLERLDVGIGQMRYPASTSRSRG